MKDPFNAMDEEIIAWAYDLNDDSHVQDWDLASVAHVEKIGLLVSLIVDKECPRRLWALEMLYIISGDWIRRRKYCSSEKSKKYLKQGEQKVLFEIKKYEEIENEDIKLWIIRTKDLYKYPEKYNVEAWYDGGLAYGEFEYTLSD